MRGFWPAGWSWRKPAQIGKEIFFGMALHDLLRFNMRLKGELDNLFIIVAFGDLLGLPIMSPYYSLRLIPYIVPQMESWPRRLLRERDFTDLIG